ncbi:DUF4227 family protein [Aneurinibacillus aneurinilyticus]|jgi:hypothetical protein|uniref:DUF4227 family protein n=2 Tax=Aneurinibacillus aneurinilyticus TaxID=1391 RepID=A0A848CQX9_ANEAE|nr:DUF4227 family protein [Aneurinibacillus aneurinilyticus]ERI05931.1 hypothetical protein HMPREF0083_05493 [Aneurinibacillus aneurinilyticus ATCC 12856]MED0672728.1 DUF4227 family protein [Aneurinibacillus aneurinilyticus]MED0708555.1 DUF4227 family protein [Aneurinibacillus aneurinilyticus]MED0721715.1 DUF4227 family protein [Aneurinibacillus aneurinilyticus]MED0731839.1 DUF4227 family protein [Aneurinibacillus aneurinilyticus]
MFIPYSRIGEGVRLLAIFIFCTFIFYTIISYVSDTIRPLEPYKEPHGKAVKVMQHTPAFEGTYKEMKRRLFDFYWYGE